MEEGIMMLENPAIIWLGLIILFLAIEIWTLGLTTIWFAGGALAAFISTFFGASAGVQRTIFVVLSVALLIITRPIAVNYMKKKPQEKTNADSLIGKLAVASREINNLAQSGEVMIADVSWTARSNDDARVISEGSTVRICAIQGVKLIVEEVKEEK